MPNAVIRRIVFVYTITIFVLVTLPFNSDLEPENITVLNLRGDYLLHVLIFLPWLFFYSAMRFKLWQWLTLGILFASFAEGLHYVLPYRVFNINDLLANVMGVVLGFVLLIAFNHFRKSASK